jgi:hypothetical protein
MTKLALLEKGGQSKNYKSNSLELELYNQSLQNKIKGKEELVSIIILENSYANILAFYNHLKIRCCFYFVSAI